MYRRKYGRNLSCICLLLLLCLTSCQRSEQKPVLPFYNQADFTPLFFQSMSEADQAITHRVAAFRLLDQHHQWISNEDVKGKIHVANFFFTRCGSICPAMMRNMLSLQQRFAANQAVEILSFSVTPWIDSVGLLQAYAARNNITAPNWHLLTGSRQEIYQLARQSYFAEETLGLSKDSSNFLHTEHVLLVDAELRLRGIYNGTLPFDMEQLARDIPLLEKEMR